MLPQLNAPYLHGPGVEHPIVPGQRADPGSLAGEEHDPPVAAFDVHADAGADADLSGEARRSAAPGCSFHPEGVDDPVQHLVALLLSHLDRGEEDVAAEGGDALMAFNPSVPGVPVPGVPEADDEHPLPCPLQLGVHLVIVVFVLRTRLEAEPSQQDRLEHLWQQSSLPLADVVPQLGDVMRRVRTAGAAHRLRADVVHHHDVRVQRGVIQLHDILMQTNGWFKDQSPAVRDEEFFCGLPVLRHVLLPGDEVPVGHRGVHLHLADGGPRAEPGEQLERDVGAAGDVQDAAEPALPVEERLRGVQMEPPLQGVERGAVHDASVAEVRFCFLHGSEGVPGLFPLSPEVDVMVDAPGLRPVVQQREEDAVAVHRGDHIRVRLLDAADRGEDGVGFVVLLDHLIVQGDGTDRLLEREGFSLLCGEVEVERPYRGDVVVQRPLLILQREACSIPGDPPVAEHAVVLQVAGGESHVHVEEVVLLEPSPGVHQGRQGVEAGEGLGDDLYHHGVFRGAELELRGGQLQSLHLRQHLEGVCYLRDVLGWGVHEERWLVRGFHPGCFPILQQPGDHRVALIVRVHVKDVAAQHTPAASVMFSHVRRGWTSRSARTGWGC